KLRVLDIAVNAAATLWGVRHIPPDQLLRRVFETCRTFEEARRQLETVPVARTVFFTLVGCRNGERCVIERTEEGATTRMSDTVAANDWLINQAHWEAASAAPRFSPARRRTRLRTAVHAVRR